MDFGLFFFASVSIGMTVAGSPGIHWNPYVNRDKPSPHRYNYFDAELLEVLSNREDGNVIASPLAVKVALEMLMEGAAGRSAEEIRAALRLIKEDKEETPVRLHSLREGAASEYLKLATQIFVTERAQIDPEYQRTLKNLGTEIAKVRFHHPRETADAINRWVANSTSGLLTQLVDEGGIDPESMLMLATAVHFKGKWLRPFKRKSTNSMCFRTGNKCVQVAMMTDSGPYQYAYIPKLDADAINIPYEGNRFSILVVLPKKYDCRQLTRDMLHVSLEEILSELREQEIHVRIPRFTMASKGDLRPYLQEMNIVEVFGPRAEMSRIFPEQRDTFLVNKILSSAKIEVNEEGTEAAAAIGSLFVPLMGGSPTSFVADHPFLFFVRDNLTGAVLFSGKLERPDGETETKDSQKTVREMNVMRNSRHPEGRGVIPFPGRVTAVEESERGRYTRRRLSPPLFQTSGERYHATLDKVKKMNHGRTLFNQDAISFEFEERVSTTNSPFERRRFYGNYPKYK